MAGRPLFALLALILIAGGLLLNIFIILSGVIDTTPMPKIWFLSANTGASGAPTTSAWTYFSLCSLTGGETSACGHIRAAFPFDPASQLGSGVPSAFSGTSYYFYLSRVAWSFYLISGFFGACALFTGILALCTRLGSVLSGLNAFMAMASAAVASALMTAWTVKARNAWRASGHASDLGRYGYGFSWASFACYTLAMIFFCCGGGSRKKTKTPTEEGEATEVGAVNEPGNGFFGRNNSQRSRAAGVKDEYS